MKRHIRYSSNKKWKIEKRAVSNPISISDFLKECNKKAGEYDNYNDYLEDKSE